MAGDSMSGAADRAAAEPFFFRMALGMALLIITAFSMQWLLGLSSFTARPMVHAHAIVFMGWTLLFTVQSWLGAHGSVVWHRRLGWIAVAWTGLMIVMAIAITVDVTQRGIVTFFFQPQLFLIANPLTVAGFIALFAMAIANRRRTDWHRRLHMGAMALLLGPAFGRILPMPLLMPHAFEIGVAAGLVVPIIGAWRDYRLSGRIHPAWWRAFAAFTIVILLIEAIVWSPLGDAIYAWVTAGTPGAQVDPLGFPPPPPG